MDNESKTLALCKKAKGVASKIVGITDEKINEALLNIAASLLKNADKILSANAEDMKRAEGVISPVMLEHIPLERFLCSYSEVMLYFAIRLL